jgi:hypothetical protein
MNNTYYTIDPIQSQANGLWQSDLTNKKMLSENGITSNWKYRQYMQKNANQLMKFNTMQTINDSGNNPYSVLNTNTTNSSPYLYRSTHDTVNPEYGFRNSDLKQAYMTKIQIKSKMISPFIPTNF